MDSCMIDASILCSSDMSDPAIIDPQAIENLRALDPESGDEFLKEIIGIFVDDTPKRIAELDEALKAGDTVKFSRAAHSIKGASSNLGALALRTNAERLEHTSKQSGLAGLAPLIATIKSDFEAARNELNKLVGR